MFYCSKTTIHVICIQECILSCKQEELAVSTALSMSYSVLFELFGNEMCCDYIVCNIIG